MHYMSLLHQNVMHALKSRLVASIVCHIDNFLLHFCLTSIVCGSNSRLGQDPRRPPKENLWGLLTQDIVETGALPVA